MYRYQPFQPFHQFYTFIRIIFLTKDRLSFRYFSPRLNNTVSVTNLTDSPIVKSSNTLTFDGVVIEDRVHCKKS